MRTFIVLLILLLQTQIFAADWNGFKKQDFQLNGRNSYLITPKKAASGNPWVWRARFPNWHTEMDIALLKRGFHIAYTDVSNLYGSAQAIAQWDAFYIQMTEKYKLHKKPALECVSRGGLIAYNWAKLNADKVACIYAEAPVCDIKSWPGGKGSGAGSKSDWKNAQKAYKLSEGELILWKNNPIDNLQALAKARVPILHVISLEDKIVPPAENTFTLFKAYTSAGGIMTIHPNLKGPQKLQGHHFPIENPQFIIDFIERNASDASPDSRQYFIARNALKNSRIQFEKNKHGRVAFLGGSITYNPGWRPMLCESIKKRFPQTTFDFIHTGIPSFGSTPHAFRFKRDVWNKGKVDLLFVEAAVNDSGNGRSSTEMTRAMEGVVRQARALNPEIDIIFMHFVDPNKIAQYNKGEVPAVIQAHEKVAEHYQLISLDLAREVTERIAAKEFTWAGDFKNLHPSAFGQKIYHRSMNKMLQQIWAAHLDPDDKVTAHAMPNALDKYSYEAASIISINDAKNLNGFTHIKKWKPTKGGTRSGFVNTPALVAEKPGDNLSLQFSGRGIGLWVAAGYDAGIIEYRIDGGAWKKRDLFTRWSRHLHLPWLNLLEAELSNTEHTLEVRISADKNKNSLGHACRIFHFCVNK